MLMYFFAIDQSKLLLKYIILTCTPSKNQKWPGKYCSIELSINGPSDVRKLIFFLYSRKHMHRGKKVFHIK